MIPTPKRPPCSDPLPLRRPGRPLTTFAGLTLALAAALPAQGRPRPSFTLATQDPFQATHFYNAPGQVNNQTAPVPQNLPAGYRGFLSLCDLDASVDIDVSQVDFMLSDDGSIRYNWGPAPGVAGGPALVGQTAVVNVYTTPTSWVGLAATPAAWTLVATGTLTVQPHDQHSPAVFSPSFRLPAGHYGLAVEVGPVTAAVPHITYMSPPYALHPYILLASSAPGAPMTAKDQFLDITNEDITNQAFVTNPIPVAKSSIFELHYVPAGRPAYWTSQGAGCYDQPRAFYEVFPGSPGTFDLSNSSIALTPQGDSYQVSSSSAAVRPPASAPLLSSGGGAMADDSRTAVLPLGFTFPYPGGSTTSVVATTNGNLFLDPANSGNQTSWFDVVGVAGFLKGQPQFAPLWSDLDPSTSGSMHFDVDAAAQAAYVTWLDVPDWNSPGSANTFQVALFANGDAEFRYGACSVGTVRTLVGWTSGWSAQDPGERDLSRSLPFTTGDGTLPPALTLDARPIMGTTPNLVVTNVPANASCLALIGLPVHGVDLFFLGMPGCVQQVVPLQLRPFQAGATIGSLPLQLPNGRWLVGAQIGAQVLVTSPGSNAADRIISNTVRMELGN